MMRNQNGTLTYQKQTPLKPNFLIDKLEKTINGEVPSYDNNNRNPGNNRNPPSPCRLSKKSFFNTSAEGELILMKMDVLLEKVKNVDNIDIIKSEWVIVARTIDRFFLIMFVLFYVGTILACFLQPLLHYHHIH